MQDGDAAYLSAERSFGPNGQAHVHSSAMRSSGPNGQQQSTRPTVEAMASYVVSSDRVYPELRSLKSVNHPATDFATEVLTAEAADSRQRQLTLDEERRMLLANEERRLMHGRLADQEAAITGNRFTPRQSTDSGMAINNNLHTPHPGRCFHSTGIESDLQLHRNRGHLMHASTIPAFSVFRNDVASSDQDADRPCSPPPQPRRDESEDEELPRPTIRKTSRPKKLVAVPKVEPKHEHQKIK